MKGYKELSKEFVKEVNGEVLYLEHEKTGAKLLSVNNSDDNKVFGITFKTPVSDSTGVAHILEHTVLCGSKKYPLKEPFMELVKCSLQTFLNAMTYPDKTVYPVASQNNQDFENLVNVYLDSVFNPLLKEEMFKQEGWHYELEEGSDKSLSIQGVVYNEMKGAFSDPMDLLYEYTQRVMFDKCSYRHSSGGNPEFIPELTFSDFIEFHKTHYHPSNALIYFYGDYPLDKQTAILEEYLSSYEKSTQEVVIDTQDVQTESSRFEFSYDPGDENDNKGMCTVNWLLKEELCPLKRIELVALDYMLLSSSSAPLRDALLKSELGESVIGGGLQTYLKQLSFSVGLKGIDVDNCDKLHKLVKDTIEQVVKDGFTKSAKDAVLNTLEFTLRENNTGTTPRGLVLMQNLLSTWLHGACPITQIKYEDKLSHVKEKLNEAGYFENLLKELLIKHSGDITVVLKPESGFQASLDKKETDSNQQKLSSLSEDQKKVIIEDTVKLKELQKTKDTKEALESLPVLKVSDLGKKTKTTNVEIDNINGIDFHCFKASSNGVAYTTFAFDIGGIPKDYLPFLAIYSKMLFQVGTEKLSHIELSEKIDIETGGTWAYPWVSDTETGGNELRVMLRAKFLDNKVKNLLDIWKDVLFNAKFSDNERVLQLIKQSKARIEGSIVPAGHRYAIRRSNSNYTKTNWIQEQLSGISQLQAIREIEKQAESNFSGILEIFNNLTKLIFCSKNLKVHITADESKIEEINKSLIEFISQSLEEKSSLSFEDNLSSDFEPTQKAEAFIIPARVHYVTKSINLYSQGFKFSGDMMPISNQIRNDYLLNQIRIMGGAYGGFSSFDRFSGVFSCSSYRDPHLERTLNVYDELKSYLENIEIDQSEIDKAIIGVIGSLDSPELPDAEGVSSFVRYLCKVTNEKRQEIRDEVFETNLDSFKKLGDCLGNFSKEGLVTVIGPEESIKKYQEEYGYQVYTLF